MNFKNNKVLLLVVAFLAGFFFHKILKGCHIVEGQENPPTASDDTEYEVSVSIENVTDNEETTTHMERMLKPSDFKQMRPAGVVTAKAISEICNAKHSYPKIRLNNGLCQNEMFNASIAKHTCIEENMTHFKNNNTICTLEFVDNPGYDYDLDEEHCNIGLKDMAELPSDITNRRKKCCERYIENNMEFWGMTRNDDDRLGDECKGFYDKVQMM
jgi:hypothetical protein